MKKAPIFSLLIFLFAFSIVKGQEPTNPNINPEDAAFRAKFSHLDFNGKFYILAVKDAVNNYYMVDFSQFPDKFERVYFVNLVYKSDKIVNIDSDLSQDRVWFEVNRKYSEKEAGEAFDQLRQKTTDACASFTKDEKAEWMMKNDKFH